LCVCVQTGDGGEGSYMKGEAEEEKKNP
jgi:hypothetical protein